MIEQNDVDLFNGVDEETIGFKAGWYESKSKHLENQLAESQNQTMRAVELAEDFNNKSQLVLQAMKDLTQAYVELKNRGCRHETFSTKTLDKDIYV